MPKKPAVKTAPQFLVNAIDLMDQRGQTYDNPTGERSAHKTAQAFTDITGRQLTESDVWLILLLLKLVRQNQGPGFHRDSAEDAVSYSALYAESLAETNKP